MSNSAVIGFQREVWERGNVIKQPLSFKKESHSETEAKTHTKTLKPDRPELSDPFLWLFLSCCFLLTTFSVRGGKKNPVLEISGKRSCC